MAEPKIIQKEETEIKEPVLEVPTATTLEEIQPKKEIINRFDPVRSSLAKVPTGLAPLGASKTSNGIDGREVQEYDQKVLDIARVTRVTKGGKRFTFRAAIVIGNKAGKVGFGIGKGHDVAQSVDKAFKQAKKYLINVVFKEGTIPHQVEAKIGSAVVFLKPAPKGSGVRAGGPMRVIAKLAGIEDVSGKIISKTNNKINIAKATIEALKKLKHANPRNKTNN